MPKLERQDWRPGDAADILMNARIIGRAQGSAADGGRFDGLIVAVGSPPIEAFIVGRAETVPPPLPPSTPPADASSALGDRTIDASDPIPTGTRTFPADAIIPTSTGELIAEPTISPAGVKLYVVYWLKDKSNFLVEELHEGYEFVCETCGAKGVAGVDGPLYGLNGGVDRDPRDASPPRCKHCPSA